MTADPPPAQPPPDPGAVTILRPVDRRRLMTKEYTLAANGKAERESFSEAKTFAFEQRHVDGIDALHRLVVEIERDPAAFVIRGEPLATTDRNAARRLLHDRPANAKTGEAAAAATYFDTPRAWLMLDADKIALPATASVINDPADVAQSLVDLYTGHAPELEGVTAVVQFSSSAGIAEIAEAEAAAGMSAMWSGWLGKGGTVSAHIWFYLAEPQDGAALKRWALAINAKAGAKVIDTGLFSPVQVHYTAAPIFSAGLRDPLAGRRVVLLRGHADAAELTIPAEAPRPVYSGGTSATAGVGFDARLEAIGRTGFHAEINGAIASFVASNWPNPDTEALVALLQQRIEAADPGGRTQGQMAAYADAGNLRRRIDWTMAQERLKRDEAARLRAEAEARDAIAPTFPDRSVTLAEGRDLAAAAVAEFADLLRVGERPDMLLRVSVGGGKSEAAVQQAPALLGAAREGGREGALYYMVPRLALGSEIAARVSAAHGGKPVAIWRGMDRPDPDAPGKEMCHDPELPKAAAAAGLDRTAVCGACPLRAECGYQRQRMQRADIWLGAHQLAFQALPRGLPKAAVVVVDEAFWPAALKGHDGQPIQMALSALDDKATGMLGAAKRERLLYLRHKAAQALRGRWDTPPHEPGGLLRSAFASVGMTADDASEWGKLEWSLKPNATLEGNWSRAALLERLGGIDRGGFLPLRVRFAGMVRDLLESDAARSVNMTLTPDADLGRGQGSGPAIRFEWRRDFAQWAAEAPKLLLDATTHPDLVRTWAPDLRVADVEIAAPMQHTRQILCEAGRTFWGAAPAAVAKAKDAEAEFVAPGNLARLVDLLMVETAEAAGGGLLVIAQEAVETLLRRELQRRNGGTLPRGVALAHHGNVTGSDAWRDVSRLVVVGRPATNRTAGERLAEIIAGKPVETVADGERAWWPTVTAGIRRPDGKATPVDQPRHPDALVEAIRWSITEGAVIQAVGRARGVQRQAPMHVTIIASLALPMTVETVEEWGEAIPDRLTVAAAEAAIGGKALPLAPADLAAARTDLFGSETAAKRGLEQAGSFERADPLIRTIPYKRSGPFKTQTLARYRKGLRGRWSLALVPSEGGEDALAAVVGPLAAYAPAPAPDAAGTPQAAPAPAPVQSPAPAPPDPPEPTPEPPGDPVSTGLWVMGADPPFTPLPGPLPPPPEPPQAAPLRLVPPPPPPTVAERLADLAARLDSVKPPRLHGDGLDLVRIDWWHQRRAAAAAAWAEGADTLAAGGAG